MLVLVVDAIEEVRVEWSFLSRVVQAVFVARDKLARAVLVLGLVVLEGDSDGVATALGVVCGGLEWKDERQVALTEIIPCPVGSIGPLSTAKIELSMPRPLPSKDLKISPRW